MERIVIRFVERPDFKNQEKMIKWFCEVFGLSGSENESDSIEQQILMSFIQAAYKDEGLGSSELKLDTKLARSTVIYHLNRFIDAGLLVKRGRKYYLRASEMSKAIEEIEYDINREMQRMLDTAKEFDRLMETNMKKSAKLHKGVNDRKRRAAKA
jgi:predicted transcriptional regulator